MAAAAEAARTMVAPVERVDWTDIDPDRGAGPRTASTGRSRIRLPLTTWVALIGLASAMLLTTLWAETRAAGATAPHVTLLGCGSSLSVLVTAGQARILVAAGDDPAAASRALGTAMAATSQRIDLLIVAATDSALLVPAELARDPDIGEVIRLGNPHPGRQTGDLPNPLPQVPAEARIDVAPGVTMTIETVMIPGEQRGDFDLAWRAVVRSGIASVTILSDTEHAGEFASSTSTGVLVAARGDDLGDLLPSAAGALVVNAGQVDGSEVRALVPPLLDAALPTIRVHEGNAVTLPLTEAGVELPPEHVVTVEPAP